MASVKLEEAMLWQMSIMYRSERAQVSFSAWKHRECRSHVGQALD